MLLWVSLAGCLIFLVRMLQIDVFVPTTLPYRTPNWRSAKDDGCRPHPTKCSRLKCRENKTLLTSVWGYITKIVPSEHSMQDEMVWLLEKSGTYSTKTGSAVARLNVEGKHNGFEWRRYVWNVTCSPKIKQFLWKLKHKVLVVGESLVKRGGREM